MKYTLTVDVSVPDDIPATKVLAHLNSALSIGCEHMDSDNETEMPGIVGEFTITKGRK